MTDGDNEALLRKLAARLGFLKQDPKNRRLLLETADLALEAGDPDQAIALLERAGQVDSLSFSELNVLGLAAIKAKRFDLAVECFETVARETGEDEPGPRFNLAWSLAVLSRSEEALPVLTDQTARILPQAATLKVQLLHKLGNLDEAMDQAKQLLECHPEHPGLLGAVSVLAIDCEDLELAAETAARAGEQSDALTTLGTLALGEEDAATARRVFERALAIRQDVPRAWVGRGLAKLLDQDPLDAARDIEKGAELFGDHLGSWIAAGWARFVGQDYAEARRIFEHALALDPTFSEAHGSMAVIEIQEGLLSSAAERVKVATRLDRNCFSAAFARTLLASADGDQDKARVIFEKAVNVPIGKDGRTIAQSLAKMGLR
ncbi:tetratricopeptide repeat protein [Novosphingobium fuchskuhlense]|nr:tetratricopeptide repeat protein [Novosphingobium fuchskuhlense]